jgi:hypothetical protein
MATVAGREVYPQGCLQMQAESFRNCSCELPIIDPHHHLYECKGRARLSEPEALPEHTLTGNKPREIWGQTANSNKREFVVSPDLLWTSFVNNVEWCFCSSPKTAEAGRCNDLANALFA